MVASVTGEIGFVPQMGEVSLAENAFFKLVVNVLAHIRGVRLMAPASPAMIQSPQRGRLAGITNREESGEVHIRVIFFARFLGIRHENKLPLPLTALNVYLGALVSPPPPSVQKIA